MSAPAVNLILEKIASKDKDFRYMATSDLLNELGKDTFKVDAELEKKLCAVITVQLEDPSGDISGLAVKCFGLLVRKVGEPRAVDTIRELCDKVINAKKEQSRDIASIGLKTVISELSPGSLAASASALITGKMLEGVQKKDNFDVASDALDILSEVVSKFGNLVPAEHARIKTALLPYLDDSRALIRKRALHCIGAVSVYLSDDLLNETISHLLSQMGSNGQKPDVVRTYMQTIGLVSRAVGWRFGRHLGVAVPLVIRYCGEAKEGDDELREFCLQALESFVLRSSQDAKAHLEPILSTALSFLRYDPNFADDMEDDDDGGDDGDDDDEDAESEEEYSDDEDVSWKVRRAAAKVLSAVINAYPDLLSDTYRRVAGDLVARYREREESVKGDVFQAHIALLRQIGHVSSRYSAGDPSSPLALLHADVPAVFKAAGKQLSEKSVKTKVGVFMVLKELVAVLPESAAEHMGELVPGILAALSDKSSSASSLKIEALQFLRSAMESNDPAVFTSHLPKLMPAVVGAASERYYKVAAEALRVCEQSVRVMRPSPTEPVARNLEPLVKPLYDAVMKRLSAQDQDQEVKECAIMCVASIVAVLGDKIDKEVPGVLRLLLERLRNEITRLTAVKGFTTIAQSQLSITLPDNVLASALSELTSFLRKANRLLRGASLAALEALAGKYGDGFEASVASPCIEEAAALVSDADLSLTAAALRFFVTLLLKKPALAPIVVDKVLPQCLSLVHSHLLQGAALTELQEFFSALVQSGAKQASFETLFAALLAAGRDSTSAATNSKQAQTSAAQCIAVLVRAAGDDRVKATVEQLLGMLKKDTGAQRLALLCLGEIGRLTNLSSYPSVESSITSALASDSEDIKSAASQALGGVTCGNLAQYLPSLLQHINAAQAAPKQQYLLLQALNEVISTITSMGQRTIDLSEGDQRKVLQLLLGNCEGEEECRNVVAECLGRLVLLHPASVLGELRGRLASPSANVRCVVVGAIKFSVTDRAHPVDEQLKECLLDFLMLMGDADRHVRKAAVVALSAAAHYKPGLVAPHLPTLLPQLYEQTVVRPELIRTVDLGPFKHKIDDGLELRKAAFEALDILLDSTPDRLDSTVFLTHLESGLRDHYDVKLPAHLMLSKLASSSGDAVLQQLERLVEPLEKTLTARLKGDSVKQEIDRHEDMLRSCLRAVDALAHLPGVEGCGPFQAFMRRTVLGTPSLKEKYTAIERERTETAGNTSRVDAMEVA